MPLNQTTPGVFVQEISTLPPSVVPVPTAVPVFIGYTEKAIINGTQWDYTNKGATDPIRVGSLLDYQAIFGGPFLEPYTATVNDVSSSISVPTGAYTLFTNLQMFYANGGGNCFIISVGGYSSSLPVPVFATLLNAIPNAEKSADITLIVVPEAATSSGAPSTDIQPIYDGMLAQCAKLQDRFAILDVQHTATNSSSSDADAFRNSYVGINNLKYGAAYYPPLNTSLVRPFLDSEVQVADKRTVKVYTDTPTGGPYNNLFSVKNGLAAWARILVNNTPTGDSIIINNVTLSYGTDFGMGLPLSPTTAQIALSLKNAINGNPNLNTIVTAIIVGQANTSTIALLAINAVVDGTLFTLSTSPTNTNFSLDTNSGQFHSGSAGQQNTGLYNTFISFLNANTLTLHPSSTMAGIYAAVDNSRGVWKAPANTSLTQVGSLTVNLTDSDQGYLNVDPIAGKSIDAMRAFTGKGLLVWGARTLDGNDNEWRYVNVRRTTTFIETSCKLASEFVVFEPNDKNTWLRVKAMITNFLNDLWRDGALAGAKPEDSFFVKVGLGETMTADDILNGRLIVIIGLAVVRPAEFIILQFEHLVQQA